MEEEMRFRRVTGRGSATRRVLVAATAAAVAGFALAATGFAHTTATPLEQARAVLKTSTPPTTIAVTTPSKKPFPTGSKYQVVEIHSGNAGATLIANATRDAIKNLHLGWKFTVIPSTGTPETVQNAWTTALRLNPSAIIGTGFPSTGFAKQLAEAQKRHIPVFNGYVVDQPGPGYYPFGGAKDVRIIGQLNAAWVTADTQGKANVLFVDLSAFPILKPVGESFKVWYAKYCPGCKLDSMDMPVTALGKDATDRLVSYARAHPDLNYIVYSTDSLGIGLGAALKAAGLGNKIKTTGNSPSPANLADIASGVQTSTVSQGFWETYAGVIDATARLLTKQPVAPGDLRLRYWLYTKNTPTTLSGSTGPVVKDLYARYLKLWPKK
jgi:ABC-type sugar transport system substrate-binding protein